MRKNRIPTLDRGMSTKTKAAVLDRHFAPRNQVDEGRRVLPMSKVTSRTSASDRLPELLHKAPAEAPRKDVEQKPVTKNESKAKKNESRTPPAPPTPDKKTGFQPCPQPRDGETPLVRQSIPMSLCEQRQAKNYHKCATCTFAKGRLFKGVGLPPLDNSPAHLQHARLLGLFGPDGEWLRR